MTLRSEAARGTSAVARIGVATAVSSLAGYVLLAVVGRVLEPADFGLFVAFWGVLFGLGSSLSTIEQESARRAASGTEMSTGPPSSAVATAAAALAALVAATTLLPPVAARVYGAGDSRLGGIVVVAALGFAVQFAVRGRLIGTGAVRSYAWLVVAEAVARLVVLFAVLAVAGSSLVTAAVAVAAGSFAWLVWAGRALDVVPARRLRRATWRAATTRAGSLMVGAALTASVITGFPTLVTALTGGAPGAAGGAVFAALTVSRVPLLLLTPVQALAVPLVVRARRRASPEARRTVRTGLVAGTTAFVLFGLVAAGTAWAIGPQVVRLLFGDAYDVPAPTMALLLFSACLLAWTLLLSAALIALAQHRAMLVLWGAAVGSTVLWLVLSPLDVVGTTAIGSLVGPVAALAWGIPVLWRLADSDERAG